MKTYMQLILCLLACTIISLPAAPVGLSLPDTSGVAGEVMEVAVMVQDDLSGQGVLSYQLQINFTNSRLRFEEVVSTGTLTQTLGNYTANQTANNQLMISAAGSTPLTGKGKLIILRFTMIASGTASLSFTDTLNNFFNEGSPSVNLQNGRVIISNPPVITVNPNNGLLAVGESLNFSVSGGTAPYTWSLTEPATGNIESTGTTSAKFTAGSAGFTKIIAEDNTGIIDTSNSVVEIRPLTLDVPDTIISEGQTVDIPVLISEMAGLEIISGELTLTFSANILTVTDVLTNNTLLNGSPEVTFKSSPGTVTISFAATNPLTGSGKLCVIRMASNFNYSGTSNLILAGVVFNEDVLAKLYNGSCRVNKLPALSIVPSTANLFTGDTLRFSVTGSSSGPLIWSTSDTEIATITNSGLLTAIKGGQVTVSVTDAASATGISGAIKVYDTRITIPDTTAIISSYIDVPVYIDAIRSADFVYSVQGTFNFDDNILSIANVITEGTIGTGWAYAVNVKENSIIFAGAGTNGTRAAGKIATLRFLVKAGINSGAKGLITLRDVLLNEGAPLALLQNGSVTGTLSDIPATPALISPSEGASVAPENAIFKWTLSTGTQNYHLQIDTADDFSAPVIDMDNISDTVHVITTLSDLTAYYWRIRATNILGESAWSASRGFQTTVNGISELTGMQHPREFALGQNYPNPFNPNTTIEFMVPRTSNIRIDVFNALGERLDVLVNQELGAGNYRVEWNARQLSSGIYYYRLSGDGFSSVKRMLLIQ